MKEIILIGNYEKDRQESMERFAQMLSSGFNKSGLKTQIWRPNVVFGKSFHTTTAGIGKWFGYIDKWILFPLILFFKVNSKDSKSGKKRFHICDHSNSPYLKYLPSESTVITCHDVLAIRGALGFADAYCPASSFGKVLQKWILQNLIKAKSLASVSQFTLDQLRALDFSGAVEPKNWKVIYNSFNADFFIMDKVEANSVLVESGIETNTPFLLHVGSALPRKNRKLLIDMLDSLGNNWNGKVFFAGKSLDNALVEYIKSKNLQDRVISIVRPDHRALVALYNLCEAFVFPSFSEGFGWPVIEAQACGAVVIASNLAPMPEVSGGAALHSDPNKPEDFAKAFLSLSDIELKNQIVKKGLENVKRFSQEIIIGKYLKLHGVEEIN